MQTTELAVTREGIADAHGAIAPYVRRTPVLDVRGPDLDVEISRITFKLESLQQSGSFKARGAFANLLLREIPPAGIVAASGGNHGVAVAYAAMTLHVKARIFVPRISSPAKIERIRRYGAHLEIGGEGYTEAFELSERWREQSGAMAVHAFDAVETLLGTGTIGRELEEQTAGCDTLIVPVGGGGLISGIASWFGGRVKIVAVEPRDAPKLTEALRAGRPVDAPVGGITADSLGPTRIGTLTLPIIKRYVGSLIQVSDEDMRAAQLLLWERLRIVAEPGGAAASAALFTGHYRPSGSERVCVLISGANTTAVDFSR